MTNPTTITAEPGTPFVDIVREFDATPEELFRVQTDPRLIEQWLGPREYAMRVEEYDVRAGGKYRYVNTDASGNEFGFHGVFHSVDPAKLVIQTWEWEGMPGQATLERASYEDLGNGRTRLTTRTVFPSVEARDATVASGMSRGILDSHARLDELLSA
ncbi:MAG: SRPBCC family protein [Rhodoglobus sp.]